MACLGFNFIVSIFTEIILLDLLPHGSMIIMTGQLLVLNAASSSHRTTHSVHIVTVCCDIYVTCCLIVCGLCSLPHCVHTSCGSVTNQLSH